MYFLPFLMFLVGIFPYREPMPGPGRSLWVKVLYVMNQAPVCLYVFLEKKLTHRGISSRDGLSLALPSITWETPILLELTARLRTRLGAVSTIHPGPILGLMPPVPVGAGEHQEASTERWGPESLACDLKSLNSLGT